MKERIDKESVLERYLCYRALVLAILGRGTEAEALKIVVRSKSETTAAVQPELVR